MHKANTLYVLTDGGRARFIRPTETKQFRTIRAIESAHIHDRSHTLGHASPSRVQESASPTRHAVEPREDPHDRAERDFAKSIAQMLNDDQRSVPSMRWCWLPPAGSSRNFGARFRTIRPRSLPAISPRT